MPIQAIVRSAVAGMTSHRLAIDVIANNLANVNTTGFKAGRLTFHDLLYDRHRWATDNQDLRVGGGAKPAAIQRFHAQGSLQQTDRPTDIAIMGNGFFQVQLPDGAAAYTRDGSFQVDADGRLVTSEGILVVPPITVPANTLHTLRVDAEGAVFVQPPGQMEVEQIGQMQLANFANPEGLDAIGQSLFRETVVAGPPLTGAPNSDGFGEIVHGALETSNVSIADEFTRMITAQRAYTLSVRALQTLDEMLGMANSMRR